MKKIYSLMAAALLSLSMMAGTNDLLWDYTQNNIPTSSPDNGLYYSGYVNDAAGTNNGLNGVKLNSSGWAYFEKAAVAGKLKLTFADRKKQTAYAVSVYNATKAEGSNPVKGTKIADTEDVEFGASATIDLPAEATGIYIERKTGAEGVLQKIEFKEDVARTFVDFKIEFRDNPYSVILPESGELPIGVTIAGTTYNGGQHGVQGGTITVPVDGTVKFTLGACQFSSTDITVKKDGEVYATISNKAACGEQKPNYDQNVPYIYLGGAGTLTFELGSQTYLPYFFAEASEIAPCEIIFKDQTGKELSKVETYEGATLEALPEASVLPAIGEGNAFRGWFYVSGKKAQIGDPITGNTIIQAKVTPVEDVIIGSVQTYDFANAVFYPEDHETVEVNGGSFHDAQHGWYFNADGDIRVKVAGNAVVVVTLCKYSESGDVKVMAGEQELATYPLVKNETPDGTELTAKYTGNAGWLTINWTAKQYIHKVVVYNVLDFLTKDEATGYYIVPSGDAASFILALVQAGEGDKIFLPNATYDLGEIVLTTISKNNIAIIGQSMENTIILNAPDASTESIDKTATLKINKNVEGTYLQDLTIRNALDYYKSDNGRAVCLWDQGTKTVCKNVRLLSYQDTYYSNLPGAVKYLEDCEIHGTVDFICGDDGICMKGGVGEKGVEAGPQRDFLICNDTVYRAHGGFVIGSEFSGGMQRLVVKDCRFEGTDIGCRFKSAPGRGGWCEDIYCYDIIMKDIVESAFLIQSGYADRGAGVSATDKDNKDAFFPDWSNITFRNITCIGSKQAVDIQGLKGKPVHDVLFDNVTVLGNKGGIKIEWAENIKFNNCNINPKPMPIEDYKKIKNVIYNGNTVE